MSEQTWKTWKGKVCICDDASVLSESPQEEMPRWTPMVCTSEMSGEELLTILVNSGLPEQNQFVQCVVPPRQRLKVFKVVPNGHTGRRSETPGHHREAGDVKLFKYGDNGALVTVSCGKYL